MLFPFIVPNCGAGQLKQAARSLLQGQSGEKFSPSQRLHLGLSLLLNAFFDSPFDGQLAASILHLDQELKSLSAPVRAVLAGLVGQWQEPPEDRYLKRLLEKNAVDRLMAYARTQLTKEPENAFWLYVLWEYRRDCTDWKGLAEALETARCADVLRERARAEIALAESDPLAAVKLLTCAVEVFGACGLWHLGHAWCRTGNKDRALGAWREGVQAQPWHCGLILRLFDALTGRDEDVVWQKKPATILLYSYRKPNLLDATLRSLYESRLDHAQLIVLDNGSGDATELVVSAWEDKFGAQRFESVRLPVNIGAPAARNWLIEELRGRCNGDVAFVDDDVSLPRDWLGRLRAAQRHYPEAGVWGCKVVDHDAPHRIQSVDYTFHGNGMASLQIPSDHLYGIDDGSYDHMRPCTSVTGCVHMFRASELLDNGGFDIRYSPSQYDDVDRDLRLALRGGHAVYTGHMAVRHMRSSGRLAQMGRAAQGNASGNMLKLLSRFDAEKMKSINARIHTLVEQDMQVKAEWLRGQGIL